MIIVIDSLKYLFYSQIACWIILFAYIFYVNSGSEAIENAIKIARLYRGKSNIITMNGGFHGRSLGA